MPSNTRANRYRPSNAELARFHGARSAYGERESDFNPLRRYVTGRPGLKRPSTDDLIQWAAAKWGIPVDVVRAHVWVESRWRQDAMGDFYPQSNPEVFPAFSCRGGSCFESLGIAQVRWPAHPGVEPLRWKSTAFNLDVDACNARFYFDGLAARWGPGITAHGYAAGQRWLSIGALFNPFPWRNQDQLDYIAKVRRALARRAWPSAR